MARAWGFWTRYKLDLLRKYLTAFVGATRKSRTRVYLDLFGGEPENTEKHTGHVIEGSASIALQIDSPPFTHLRFFELDANARKLEQEIEASYPDRDTKVYAGDCNQTIHTALVELKNAGLHHAPTFAFIDPNGPHFTWPLLDALAKHKPGGSTKVELWMLFPDPLFIRLLPKSDERAIRPDDEAAISAMFGTREWHATYDAKLADEITPGDAREEYVNLMRWRLERELGYRWTHQLEITTETGPIYHMLFATDSEPGHKIMGWLYDRAADEFPMMAEIARNRRRRRKKEAKGEYDLFSTLDDYDEPSAADLIPKRSEREQLYFHLPAVEPRRHAAFACSHCNA